MLNKQDQLQAISWKCAQTGLSYGKLINTYSPHELNEIYKEYEEMLEKRKTEKHSPTAIKAGTPAGRKDIYIRNHSKQS